MKIILTTLIAICFTSCIINAQISNSENFNKSKKEKKKIETTINSNTNSNNDFSYPSFTRLNVGFGTTSIPGVSTIGIGVISDIAFSNRGRGNVDFELGGTTLIISSDLIDESIAPYFISGALKYGYFLTNSLKISAGAGYYVGVSDGANSDLYYSGTLDYFFTKGFGLNVRYDELLGFNFGLSFTL